MRFPTRVQEIYELLISNKIIRAEVNHTIPTGVRVTDDPAEQAAEKTIPFE